MEKTKAPNGSNKGRIDVQEIVRRIFSQAGITFDSAVFLRRKVIDDLIISQTLTTIEALAEGFQDGTYEFAIEKAVITDVGKAPVELTWVNIETNYIDGKWSDPSIYADEETISPGETEENILFERLKKIKAKLIPILEMIEMVVRVARSIRELFS